nr:Protein C49A9.10 [Haemonchus contortus]
MLRLSSFEYSGNISFARKCSSIRSLEAIVRPCASVQSRSYPPVEPMEGACCGQGCSNCVWVVYAQELIDYYPIIVAHRLPLGIIGIT